MATIAAAFWPKKVIVRLSDFKSNEYSNLLGGDRYEPHEENPMLGFRGASRYIAPEFYDCFALECEAMKRVRDDMGFTNVEIMIPFVRTLAEAEQVIELLAKNGLARGENGLRVIMMCEMPSNAILAERFLEHFDGFSIGSNDMTQLTLGVDRDSGGPIAATFDERDDAVKAMLALAIEACRKAGKYVGICGQGPSDHPDLAQWLVEQGIESMSLNPDTVVETWLALAGKQAGVIGRSRRDVRCGSADRSIGDAAAHAMLQCAHAPARPASASMLGPSRVGAAFVVVARARRSRCVVALPLRCWRCSLRGRAAWSCASEVVRAARGARRSASCCSSAAIAGSGRRVAMGAARSRGHVRRLATSAHGSRRIVWRPDGARWSRRAALLVPGHARRRTTSGGCACCCATARQRRACERTTRRPRARPERR